MIVKQLLEGKPFMTEYGIVGYSTVCLIRENGKNILYDTGNKGCALQLKAALKESGLTCGDITDVVLSHLHFDHVGNVPLFRNAVFHLSRAEWTSACDDPDEWHSIPVCDYLRANGEINFVKEGDFISDSVKVMELPGHTMGLIGLKCGEDTVLCSDAIKNRYELWQDIPLMSADIDKSRSAIARIRCEGRFIYPGHDTMLDIDRDVCGEEIHFTVRFAGGKEKYV